jgi:hypothetical protein
VEDGVAEGEHPAVAGDVDVTAMPLMGLFSLMAPVEPWKTASPKAKMPPSLATSQ